MDNPEPAVASPEDMVPLSALVQERRLVDFASRLLLALNLLLAGYLCYLVIWVVPPRRDLFTGRDFLKLQADARALFSIPSTPLFGSVAGLAAGLIILEVVARTRSTRIICNAVAIVLLLTATLFVESALRVTFWAM